MSRFRCYAPAAAQLRRMARMTPEQKAEAARNAAIRDSIVLRIGEIFVQTADGRYYADAWGNFVEVSPDNHRALRAALLAQKPRHV